MRKWLVVLVAVILLGTNWSVITASADAPLESPHYQFVESTLGEGGLTRATSPNYQSIQAIGKAAVGQTSGTDYQTHEGSNTTPDPTLSVVINSGGGKFDKLFSPTTAATATSTFSVVDYTSYGYVIEIVGDPPTYENHTIKAMTTPGSSVPGSEQFGINLVKNKDFCGTGCDVGADPDYGQFGATEAKPFVNLPGSNYGTSGTFEYNSGDTIVQSPKSSGKITYTITYLVNVNGLTPGGQYTSHQSLICIATY